MRSFILCSHKLSLKRCIRNIFIYFSLFLSITSMNLILNWLYILNTFGRSSIFFIFNIFSHKLCIRFILITSFLYLRFDLFSILIILLRLKLKFCWILRVITGKTVPNWNVIRNYFDYRLLFFQDVHFEFFRRNKLHYFTTMFAEVIFHQIFNHILRFFLSYSFHFLCFSNLLGILFAKHWFIIHLIS